MTARGPFPTRGARQFRAARDLLLRLTFGATLLSAVGCVQSPPGMHLDLRGDHWKIRFEDSARFSSPDYVDHRWTGIRVPSNWNERRSNPGVAWYRKEINLAAPLVESRRPLALYIATLVDSDETYWNGVRIGAMGDVANFRSHAYGRPRVYLIPPEVLEAGRNVLAIRVRGYFEHDAGIRSGAIYLDDPVAIQARVVLGEQLSLLITVICVALAVVYFASCVFARAWHVRGWFALSCWAAGWIAFWNTPLAFEWMEELRGLRPQTDLLIMPTDPFVFVKMMSYGGYYLLGIACVAFWTAYLRLRTTPLHVVHYSFTLLVFSACLISADLLLWNTLFDYWFYITGPAQLLILILIGMRARSGELRWRWMAVAVAVLTLTALHDWLFHNGHLTSNYSQPLVAYGLLTYLVLVAIQLARDFRHENERSDAEFQRLWALRTENQYFLRDLLRQLQPDASRLTALAAATEAANAASAPEADSGAELIRTSRQCLATLSQIEAGRARQREP